MLWSTLIQILVLFDSFALCDIHDHFLLLEFSPSLLSVTLYNLFSYFSTTFPFVLLPLLFPKWWFPPKFSVCTIMYYFFPLPVTSHRLIVLNITSQWMPPRYPFLGFSVCCIFSHLYFQVQLSPNVLHGWSQTHCLLCETTSSFIHVSANGIDDLLVSHIWNLGTSFASNFSFALNT